MFRTRAPHPGRVHDRLRIALTFLVLFSVLQALAALIPLPPQPDLSMASTFGTHDNRRLLFHYGALLGAIVLAPWTTRRNNVLEPPLDPPRSWRRSILLALPFAAIGAWLLVGPGVALSPINGHELVHLGYLSQMWYGALLNVDTFMNYGPLLGASIFGFMKLAGFNLVGFREYWHLTAILTWILTAIAAWRYLRHSTPAVFLLVYSLLFTALSWFLPDRDGFFHAAWGWANPLRHGAPALGLVFLAAPLLASRREGAFAAGALVAVLTFYAQETGPPAFLTLGALVFLGGRSQGRARSQLLAYGAGLLLFVSIICLPALARGELAAFLRATFEAPRLVLQGAANRPFPEVGAPNFWPYYVVPVAGLALLLVHGYRVSGGSREDALPAALALYGSLAFVTVLVRADEAHWQNVALPFWLLLFFDLDRLLRRMPRRRTVLLHTTTVLVLLIPLVLFPPGLGRIGAAFAGRGSSPSPAAGWNKLDMARGGIWVRGDRWFEQDEKRGSEEAIAMIRSLAGDRPTQILGSPSSLYYFLADAKAAVPYTDLTTQCVSEYHRQRLIAAYFRHKPEYTFMFKEFESNPPRPATGYRRLGDRFGLAVYQREDLEPVALPED